MVTTAQNMIVLNTYKKKDENGVGIENYEHTPLYFNRAWVAGKIAPQTLEDFLNDYTFDDTEWLLDEAKREGNTLFKNS